MQKSNLIDKRFVENVKFLSSEGSVSKSGKSKKRYNLFDSYNARVIMHDVSAGGFFAQLGNRWCYSDTLTVGETKVDRERGFWPFLKHLLHQNVRISVADRAFYVRYSDAVRILNTTDSHKRIEKRFQKWVNQANTTLKTATTTPIATVTSTVDVIPTPLSIDTSSQLSAVTSRSNAQVTKTVKKEQIIARLVAAGLPKQGAQKIAEKWASGWKGCAKEISVNGSLVAKQQHSIHGLKVIHTAEGWVGDVGLVQLGQGGGKRAKSMLRILPDGTVVPLVRLTKRKDLSKSEAEKRFQPDAQSEMSARTMLEDEGRDITGKWSNDHLYENILRLEVPPKYSSRKRHFANSVKIRYVTDPAEDDLFGLFIDKNDQPLPSRKIAENRPVALRACLGALRGLCFMHTRNMLHCDIKLDNIGIVGGVGKLMDLAMACKVSDKFVPKGTPEYVPPEFFGEPPSAVYELSMDMYSFGVTLALAADSEELGLEVFGINGSLCKREISYAEACRQLSEVQKKFRARSDDLSELIAELIDPDPTARPNCFRAFERLSAILPEN